MSKERIQQKYLRDIEIDNYQGYDYVKMSFTPMVSKPNTIILIEKSSIPDLIAALQKYVE